MAVPESLRHLVLQCAHDNCLSGHSGFKKTLSNVQAYFSWPGLSNDVRCYTRSCHVCQVRSRVRSDRPAPFQPVKLVEIPFQRVIIDIVGPLPVSQNRYEYILTLVDLSTRWAEGVPLRHISAKDVAQSLFDLFCRLGFPCEIQSDRGQQFMSQVLREFNSLTNIKHFLSSPYHPQTNGVVERFHSTLKGMLRKLAFDSPSNWCQYLNAALFAYRCQVHTSTGYSPFFLLYGRSPRGPVEILHDFMSNSNLSPETSLQYQFVIDFHNKLKAGWQLTASALKESADKSREHQSLNPRVKTFAVDEQVLVLLPSSNNKLSLTPQGPFNIAKKLSPVVYLVDFGHRVSPLHVNLLRKYHRDSPYQIKQPTNTVSAENATAKANAASHQPTAFEPALLPFAHANMEFDPLIFPFGSEDIEMPSEMSPSMTAEDDIATTAYVSTVTKDSIAEFGSSIPTSSLSHDETLRVNINPCLDSAKVQQVQEHLTEFQDILTSLPGLTTTIRHVIRLSTNEIIRIKPYPLPFASQEFLKTEISQLLSLGVIERSTSPYCSPVLIVKKKDGSLRLCIDFRKLNSFTIFDSENIPLPEDLFMQMSKSEIFSTCDLAKAYWQIPLEENSKKFTAFQTPLGLMQWTRVPFGLVTAPATFCRLVRLVIGDRQNFLSYFDDTMTHTRSWSGHLTALRTLFSPLRQHGLHANPAKLSIGFSKTEFLGHMISHGTLAPVQDKVSKLINLTVPTTKKQVRSFMGMLNYYRAFIPDFASIAAPLTNLLRKGSPEKVSWNQSCQQSFDTVKDLLSSDPILIIPDINEQFVVRSDASDTGLGAVLLQERNQLLMPCRYASRRLSPRECNYSFIERECLAIIFAVRQFSKFLAFRTFVLQTDHKPLSFLKAGAPKNSRLMRWALSLQEYSFHIVPIPGNKNVQAAALSRLC
ncbi:reverse transcriptase [Plakobranchus ocellatus]|uniref:Reverse transcriptase n=1 Tax=Plakobranchus ocellatus TaxID=259542 RepID=A0AAV4CSA1_9GAST|nr:reverse transcriptase [Plakobranchus ocellatus]